MRINVYIAQATGLSRRAADQAIVAGRVTVNGKPTELGTTVSTTDEVVLDKHPITPAVKSLTIMLNKPVGYVVSRDGQGSPTVYNLLPDEYHHLKPVGRLDKDSSGLLLLTDDGQLANQLTHPSYNKTKVYEITLDKPLVAGDKARIENGVKLSDGISQLQIENVNGKSFTVTMREGRNRQIRRTFATLGYTVAKLHRTSFGDYTLDDLPSGESTII